MDNTQGLDLTDLIGVFRRRAKLLAAVAGAALLVVYWIAMALPNRYAASTVILVEPQSIDKNLVAAGVMESDLSERLGIMTSEILSRTRLSAIITALDLYPEKARWYTREEVVDMMRGDLSVLPVMSELETGQRRGRIEKFNTFRISYSSDSPQLAAEVANRIGNDFISQHIDARVKTSQKSLDFMRAAIQDLSSRIEVVESEIAKVKEANPGRLPENLEANQRAYAEALGVARMVERQVSEAKSDEAFWKGQTIAAVSIGAPNDPSNPVFRRKVLEIERADLAARGFTEKHPDVIKLQAEISALDGNIQRLEEANAAGEGTVGYAEQNARAEQQRAALRIGTLEDEIKRMTALSEYILARIAATPAVAEKLDALTRESDQLSSSFQDFSARLQQAQVQADLERKQLGEQLRILEAAFAPPSPSSPNRLLILTMGLFLGIGLGVVVAFVAEAGDSSLHTSRDLQARLGIPVLAAIPRISLEADRVKRSRQLMREAIVVGALVTFVLVSGAITYVYVNGAPGFLSWEAEKTPAGKET